MKSLGKPNAKIGNHAICPYIEQYKDKILVVENTNPREVVKNFATFKDVFRLEAVVVHGFDWDFDKLADQIDKYNSQYRKKDVYCLGMHPNSEGSPLPLEYTFRDQPLIIIQRWSTLQAAKQNLAKNTDYYTYYKEPN